LGANPNPAFDFNAKPDPAVDLNVDPDPDSSFDADPDPAFQSDRFLSDPDPQPYNSIFA
jgi:hypothetical protein